MNTTQIVMLRLRNRVLNRFKKQRVAARLTKTKSIVKRFNQGLGFLKQKKTLRVVPKSVHPASVKA